MRLAEALETSRIHRVAGLTYARAALVAACPSAAALAVSPQLPGRS
jgi:hypothetical protein